MRLNQLVKVLRCEITVIDENDPESKLIYEGYANEFPDPEKWAVLAVYTGGKTLVYVTEYKKGNKK